MGWNPNAYVIFGFKAALSALQTTVPVRGCRHPEGPGKFCQECGKPMFEQRTETVEFDDVQDVQLHRTEDDRLFVVGVQLATTEHLVEVPAYDPPALAARIVQACAEHGITVTADKMRLFVMRR